MSDVVLFKMLDMGIGKCGMRRIGSVDKLIAFILILSLSGCREKLSVTQLKLVNGIYERLGSPYSGEAVRMYCDGSISSVCIIEEGIPKQSTHYGYENEIIATSEYDVIRYESINGKIFRIVNSAELEQPFLTNYLLFVYDSKVENTARLIAELKKEFSLKNKYKDHIFKLVEFEW